MTTKDDIWYAGKVTEVILAPEKSLETFGATILDFHVICELLDELGQVRIRKGRIHAERPKLITPHFYAHQMLENFGDEARQYAELLLQNSDWVRILQYGLRFRKEDYDEELVAGDLHEVAGQVAGEVSAHSNGLSTVIIGVDDLWEVSLLKVTGDVVRGSTGKNVQELKERGLLELSGSVPAAVRIEIESDFRAAAGDRSRIQSLGSKLKQFGLFADYEDRFYGLLRQL